MAQISAQKLVETGAAPVMTNASTGGDSFTNTGSEALLLKNSSGSAVTVTLKSRNTAPVIDGYGTVSKPDTAITVPANGIAIAGPFPQRAYNDPATSRLSLTYTSSGATSVAVIALK
ncbi:hypothetical protein [Azospirillum rugosum]|uniref:Uncharacterized protein n=1 Tax=Azospirillum rugosum TaxID=416170 RepID=A0ABS4SEP2_9PROT|nr:hypothetical protein [Azospirillum rugosum]MBP2291043.1 hypothetical protein [Azospirillum rugosum]MDQ0524893.1 hypothetical protein [Azospirillum rugosum]